MSNSLLILVVFLLTFCYLRNLNSQIIDYQVNKSARRKRKKGQTFIEWLIYKRYRNEIPRILFITYFASLIFNFITFVLSVIFLALYLEDFAFIVFKWSVGVDYGLMFILNIAFYGRRKNGQTYTKIERWIIKKKRSADFILLFYCSTMEKRRILRIFAIPTFY